MLYFKILPSHLLFKQSNANDKDSNGLNLTGLVDVSFSHFNKEFKETMHIYDSTQILYTIEQSKQNQNNTIPVLIMNHLPLDKKMTPKFDNYCALMNRDLMIKNLSDQRLNSTEL